MMQRRTRAAWGLGGALLVGLAVLGSGLIPRGGAAEIRALAVSRFVLPNGLRLVVHEDHRMPKVALSVWYRVGARDEERGQNGLAHLCEHLMFLGSRNLDGDTFARIKAIGGEGPGATTGYDRTRFFMTVPRAALDEALRIEADRMGELAPALTPQKLARAVRQLEDEIGPKAAQPDTQVRKRLPLDTLPEGHPYARFPLGEVEQVRSVRLETARGWFDKHYRPDHAVIALAGDVGAAEAEARVRAAFGALRGGPAATGSEPPPRPEPPAIPAGAPVTLPGPEDRLYLVWNVPGSGSPDADALDVIRHVLQSRLSERMTGSPPLARSVTVQLSTFELSGQFKISAALPLGEDPRRARAAIGEELGRLVEAGPDRKEIREVVHQLAEGMAEDLSRADRSAVRADLLAQSEMFHGGPTTYTATFARMRGATPTELSSVARRWLGHAGYEMLLQATPRTAAAARAPGAAP